MASEPVVVAIHHPASTDLEGLRRLVANLERSVEILEMPYKENLRVRTARSRGPLSEDLRQLVPEPDAVLKDVWRRAEVVLALDLPTEVLPLLPRLRWVQAYSSGLDHFDREALAARQIALTSAAGVGAVPIAEFVVGRLLEVWKDSRSLETMQQAKSFDRPRSRLLSGCTLGIIGFGAIGQAIAERAHALGMRVIANRKHPERSERPECLSEIHGAEGLPQILSESDAVVLCAPDNDETKNLIDARAFEQMRPGAVLCNVSRGSLVDEGALIDALESERIGAAILDVTRNEPLAKDDPLWDAPHLYLSPHCAVTPDAYDVRLLELLGENLERYLSGQPLLNLSESTC
jgi:phosphoglycerate dehydrogenase-like enzyme